MTRVSLKEAYDNKDVVAQIYAIRDIAEGAEDTADSAVTTANTASDHVDALVPQVEGAVQNANDASASAQASAQTVAGYENRLSAVEGDLNAVTLRVTTAEGQIVTIQGRVTALETADGQNVKLTGTQTIGGVKHFADSPTAPTTETGLWDIQVANGAKVKNELDNYAPMVRTTNRQSIAGVKLFDYLGGKVSMHQRVTGTSKIELFRFSVSGATNTCIHMVGMSRGTAFIGQIAIAYDGVNSIVITHSTTPIYGSPSQSALYVYLDGSEMVVCIGNETAGNNYLSVHVMGVYSGAGLEQTVDWSNLGIYRTDAITENTAKYLWGSS